METNLDPWIVIRRRSRSFGSDVEYYALLQSRRDPLLFQATRSFVAGGFEQDLHKEQRIGSPEEVEALLRDPEGFHARMTL